MSHPFILWNSKIRSETTSDDAGTTIVKSVLPPPPPRGPYEDSDIASCSMRYVPSLVYFCIKVLAQYPDQVHAIGPTRLAYRPPDSEQDFDVLRALIPSVSGGISSAVDPRLWATIAQIFEPLPERLRTLKLPLSDIHLPLLIRIPPSDHFALVTILELKGCKEVCDSTSVVLTRLTGLVALDVSSTEISEYGISVLTRRMIHNADEQKDIAGSQPTPRSTGRMALRIMRLRKCDNITRKIYPVLQMFPFLAVVDLRNTRCVSPSYFCEASGFRPSANAALFDVPLSEALDELEQIAEQREISLYSALNNSTFRIHVNRLHHGPTMPQFQLSTSHRRAQIPKISDFLRDSSQQNDFTIGNSEMARENFSDTELRHQESIAASELDKEASRRAVYTFYSGEAPRRKYTKVPRDTGFIALPDSLTLTRIPKPWSFVDYYGISPDSLENPENPENPSSTALASASATYQRTKIDSKLAQLDRSKLLIHGGEGLQSMMENKRRRVGSSLGRAASTESARNRFTPQTQPTIVSTIGAKPRQISRNPFKRKRVSSENSSSTAQNSS